MIKTIISDFSRVIFFAKDNSYQGSLNGLYQRSFKKENYNIFDYFKINTELLDFYASLKNSCSIYIFTSELIQEDPQFEPYLQPVFNGIYSAAKIGLSKNNKESYKKILQEISVKPEEAIYMDDKMENIEAAKSAGLHAFQYVDNEDLFAKCKSIISSAE